MSTIKTDRVDFEKLLNGLDPIGRNITPATPDGSTSQQVSAVVDNTSAAETMETRIFDMEDPMLMLRRMRKKARKTIMNMVKHVIPEDILEEEYIQDKIEQDTETLAGLYVQMENNTVMQTSLMTSVSRGNTMPRMYEVFSQLTDKIQSINKQILETEQKIRKTYVDLKFEVRDRRSEAGNTNNMIGGPTTSNNGLPDGSVIVTNAKDLINEAKRVRIEALKNAKETKFEEEK